MKKQADIVRHVKRWMSSGGVLDCDAAAKWIADNAQIVRRAKAVAHADTVVRGVGVGNPHLARAASERMFEAVKALCAAVRRAKRDTRSIEELEQEERSSS